MKTLETLKNTYAKEQGYEDWKELRKELYGDMPELRIEAYMDEICIRAQKEALENAEDNACNSLELYNYEYETLSKAITNPENLIR